MAMLTRLAVTGCVISLLLNCQSLLEAKLLQPNLQNTDIGVIRQKIDTNVLSRLSKRDVWSRLTKRDSGSVDPKCVSEEAVFQQNKQKSTTFSNMYAFDNETKYSMAIAWAGENDGVILVVTTEEMFIFAKPSTLYRSEDNGKTFLNINSKIQNAVIRKSNGLQKHPSNPKQVFLIAHNAGPNAHGDTSKSLLFLTVDGGVTFTSGIPLPFLLDGDIVFHPSKAQSSLMLTVSARTKELYLSKNGGQVWNKIHDHVETVKWSTSESDPAGTIYIAHSKAGLSSYFPGIISNPYANILSKSTDLGVNWVDLMTDVHNFGMQGKFLYTSVKMPQKDDSQRLMKVSTDGGKTWNEAQLPTITSDRFYSILDMTEGLIFMHVDNPGDTGHGTLYISDSTGIIFSQSLEQHLYPNYQDVTDFYKVKSMRGVYLASQMSADQSIHTVITFNRGAEWKSVNRPAGVPCKDESKTCNLQIHNMYSIQRGIAAQPPLSSEAATGIILVHGHVADALQTTPPDVYVTSNGGYTWIKALDGPHHLQIADHGGLLIAVPADTPTPNVLKFSTDEGRCWHTYNFTDQKLIFTGLLTEPGNKAMTVGIWGYGQTDHKWRVFLINFKQVINSQCGATDYEDWIAHSDMTHDNDAKYKGCLLGTREKFKRLKKDSWCYNGYSYEVTKEETTCECTKDDYECDYGYMRYEGTSNCVKDLKFKGPELDICLRGHEEKIVSEGYRRIPGDKCTGGFKPTSDKMIDVNVQCKDGNKAVVSGDLGLQQKPTGGHKANTLVIVSVVMIILLLAVVLVVFFVNKFNLLRKRDVTYKYSILSQQTEEYDYDNDFENALTNRKAVYEDTSDEEVLESGRREQNKAKPHSSRGNSVSSSSSSSKVKQYHDDSDDDLLE